MPHRAFLDRPLARYLEALVLSGIAVDVKSALNSSAMLEGAMYWSL